MTLQAQLDLLSTLLQKSVSDIQAAAVEAFVETLDPKKRDVYRAFVKESVNGSVTDPPPPSSGGPGYTLTDKIIKKQLNLNTTKGRILTELKALRSFTRADFKRAVEKAMQWDGHQFGIQSRFDDLDHADKAWWGTLKGRDKYIVPR